MKKITFWLFALFTCWQVSAQINLYSFGQSTETYAPITTAGGATPMVLLPTATSAFDLQFFHNGASGINGTITTGTYNYFPIGFTFNYAGTSYDGFAIGTDGWIKLGSTTGTLTSGAGGSPISSTTANTNDVISAFGADLSASIRAVGIRTAGSPTCTLTGTGVGAAPFITVGMRALGAGIPAGTTVTAISGNTVTLSANATSNTTSGTMSFVAPDFITYQLVGTAPNRELVVQWSKVSRFSGYGDVLNFQLRLKETTNTISFVYDVIPSTTVNSAGTVQVGLKGTLTPAVYKNRLGTGATAWSVSTDGTANNSSIAFQGAAATGGVIAPASGLTYTFSPPLPCNATPTPGNTLVSGLACFNAPVTLTLENATNGNGVAYQWFSGATPTTIAGATNSTYIIPSVTATETYYCAVTCTNTATTTNSTPINVGPSVISTFPWNENFDSLTTATTGSTNYPSCWFEENGDWTITNSTTYNTPRSGANYLRCQYSATNEYIWTPGFQLTAGTSYDFSTWVQGDNNTGWLVDFVTNSVPLSTGSTPLGLQYVVPVGGTADTPGARNKVANTFVPATTGLYFFGIKVNQPSFAPWYVGFDDFKLEVTPSCQEPIALAASNILATSVDVSWEAAATSTTTDFEYTITGSVTPPTDGTATTNTFLSLTGLSDNTQYYLHVRSNCGGAFSPWATTSFTTRCPAPTAVTVTNIATTTATINFTGVNPATGFTGGYQYIVQTTDTAPPVTATGTAITQPMPFTTPVTVNATGLTPGTIYYVFVRSTCDAVNSSAWSTSVTFGTQCDVVTTFPQLEPFNSYLPSPCWAEATGGDTLTGFSSLGFNSWDEDGFGNVGETGAARYNIYQANQNAWLVSPSYAIPAADYELKFDAAATFWSTTAPATAWNAAQTSRVEVLVQDIALPTNPWNVLYTYNETNVPSVTGINNILPLATYVNKTVRFAYRVVTAADPSMDINFYIDNFEVRQTPATAPLCAIPVATPNTCGNFANAITWPVVNGASGYRITAGSTAGGTDIANNVDLGNTLNYNLTGTVSTTYYYTIVPYNAIGSATGCTEMSFTTTATGCYCVSLPDGNDANGITNVQVGAVNFPITDVTYSDQTSTPVTVSRGVSTPVNISFATGYTYNTYIYVDFNDDFDYTDAGELVYTGESTNVNPTVLAAAMTIPATTTLGTKNMRIVTADILTTSNPCYSGLFGVTVEFKLNIIQPACTAPVAAATIVPNCATSQYSINVDVTALGSGTPSVTDSTTTTAVSAIGVVSFGPYAFGTTQNIKVLHGTDSVCDLLLGAFTYTVCPPANDDCSNAIALTPGGVFATSELIATNVGATASSVLGTPAPGCADYQGGDVWFSIVVPASGSITVETNSNTGSALTDTGLTLYSGTCGALELIQCNDDSSLDGAFSLISRTGLTAGSTIYARVHEYGNNAFDTFKISAYDATLSNESFDSANFRAYPNPVKDVLNLSYSSEISNIKVINILGQEVMNNKGNANQVQLDMANLNAGTYLVTFTANEITKTIKIVKQ
jgi:hypothetical protein